MIRILFVFLMLSNFTFAQEDDQSMNFYIPNYRCLDDEGPMFEYLPDSLESFEFRMYNRWGELMACSNDVNFELVDCLTIPREQLKLDETYTYIIFTKLEGEDEHKYMGHFYLIEYCNCG